MKKPKKQKKAVAEAGEVVKFDEAGMPQLDVWLEDETIWLTQKQMGLLFGCAMENVIHHLKNIYAEEELVEAATTKEFLVVRIEGTRSVTRKVKHYNLDAVISVGYRVNSKRGTKFRQWATAVLKEYLLRGYSVNARMTQLEDKVDRRFALHEKEIVDLKEKVDFFVQTKEPPLQGVFYDGQLWDARALVLKLISGAKKSLLLIDNWTTPEVLDLFTKKHMGVKVTIFTSEHYRKNVPHHQISDSDIATFNAQYPHLAVHYNESFHDRFLIIDDKELYLIGASLKDLGRKCFAFTKLDSAEIPRIKKSVFAPSMPGR